MGDSDQNDDKNHRDGGAGRKQEKRLSDAASKGGKARANAMTPEERSEVARLAAERRWAGHDSGRPRLLHSTHEGPLTIGDIQLGAFVLSDFTRVLSGRGLARAFGLRGGGSRVAVEVDGGQLPAFLAAESLAPFITPELTQLANAPIRFRPKHGGKMVLGYRADILPGICRAILQADRDNKLKPPQKPMAIAADVLYFALAQTGITALVDEATGFQAERERDELQRILAAYIAKGLLPWSRRFPNEFFKQLFRLYNWPVRDDNKRPHPVAHFIKEYVYGRLPNGVLEELERLNPPAENGRRRHKHHQFLTVDTGHPHLDRQIMTVTTLMSASTDMNEFRRLLDRAQPVAGTPMDAALRKPDADS